MTEVADDIKSLGDKLVGLIMRYDNNTNNADLLPGPVIQHFLKDASDGQPQVILVATGSELQLAVEAQQRLEAEGTPTRVVSMPCQEWFFEQDAAYRQQLGRRGPQRQTLQALDFPPLPLLFSPIDATLERVDLRLDLGPRDVLPRCNPWRLGKHLRSLPCCVRSARSNRLHPPASRAHVSRFLLVASTSSRRSAKKKKSC